MAGAILKVAVWNNSVPRVELDQRARDARLRLDARNSSGLGAVSRMKIAAAAIAACVSRLSWPGPIAVRSAQDTHDLVSLDAIERGDLRNRHAVFHPAANAPDIGGRDGLSRRHPMGRGVNGLNRHHSRRWQLDLLLCSRRRWRKQRLGGLAHPGSALALIGGTSGRVVAAIDRSARRAISDHIFFCPARTAGGSRRGSAFGVTALDV